VRTCPKVHEYLFIGSQASTLARGFHDSDGFYVEGNYPNASVMPHREAVALIAQCLERYIDAGSSGPRR
jgi:hypothetical protein